VSEQNSVPLNSLLAMLRVLVGVLEQLPTAIEEEVQSWMPSRDPFWGSFVGSFMDLPTKSLVKPIIDRYDLDREVLPKLQARLGDMMEACEGSSARYLRASSDRVWGEIDRIIAAGAGSLSPHGKAWVMFFRETEARLIQYLDEG
jgi:hypothetical protein